MRSLSFLASRRWVLFAIVVVLLAWLAWVLGQWQFHRLEDRKERNAIVERNTAADPVPVDDVLAAGDPVPAGEQYRRVTAEGVYDTDNTVVVRYRTRDGASGIDVVVPLVTADGTALLVDRGWLATDNRGASPDDVPPPPSGTVTVTGWVRQDASGDSTHVSDQSTRSISSTEIGQGARDHDVRRLRRPRQRGPGSRRRRWRRRSCPTCPTGRTSSTACSGGSSGCSRSSASST